MNDQKDERESVWALVFLGGLFLLGLALVGVCLLAM